MVNESALTAAVERMLNYKAELGVANNLAGTGFQLKATRMADFQNVINSASRMAMTALDSTDPVWLETLGELLINAASNIKMVADMRGKGLVAPLW